MVNNFGKFCRKLRIDRSELLYDMAKKLGVSSAFLSKVENGKKKPPKEWRELIIDLYDLNNAGTMNLKGYFYPLVSDDYELDDVAKKGVQLINVELYIKNTNWDQGLSIANKHLEVLIEPEKVDGADTLFQCVEAD